MTFWCIEMGKENPKPHQLKDF